MSFWTAGNTEPIAGAGTQGAAARDSLQCCVCSGGESRPYRAMDGFLYLRCRKCGMVYLETTRNDSERFYQDSARKLQARQAKSRHAIEYWSFPQLYAKYQEVFEYYFAERLVRLEAAGYRRGPLLDIGCGYGFFVRYLSGLGIKATGIDTAAAQVDWAKKEWGLEVAVCPVEEYEPAQPVAAVVMADVLEHVWEPVKVLRRVRDFLEPGGLLAVQVPNLLGFKVPPGHSWGVPHHLWQFDDRTLSALLRKSGYRVVAKSTGVLGVIGMHERGGPTLKERAFIWLAKRFNIGNRLLMICRKE